MVYPTRKALILLIFLTIPFILNSFLKSSDQYESQAQFWVHNYMQSATHHDLELIANLFYFSYKRSLSTLECQKTSQEALKTVWAGWQNVYHTRRNPSKSLPHKLEENCIINAAQQFDAARIDHHQICSTYVHCLEFVLKENKIDPQLISYIKEVREEAKKSIYQTLINSMIRSQQLTNESECQHSLFSLLKKFWRTLPDMTMNSFVVFDKKYGDLSDRCWSNFIKAHDHANRIWQIIEECRVSFYQAYFQVTQKYIKSCYDAPSYIIFDHNGHINEKKRKNTLPEILERT